MQYSLQLTGTGPEIADALRALLGEGDVGGGSRERTKATAGPKQYSEAELGGMDFAKLKKVATELDIELPGKKSAGLRKAILEAYAAGDEDEEEEELEDDDDEWEDDEEEEEEEDEDDEEEEEPEPPVKRPRGRPRKAAAEPAPAAKKPRGRPRTR